MADPIYPVGLLAWIMEATAITVLYLRSTWNTEGLWGALKLSWSVSLFAAASAVVGIAAKVEISNLTLWFSIAGGFVFLHGFALGIWLFLTPKGTARA